MQEATATFNFIGGCTVFLYVFSLLLFDVLSMWLIFSAADPITFHPRAGGLRSVNHVSSHPDFWLYSLKSLA
jgi:hypothetical protein